MPGSVWAFDFDGVVCDSVGESSLSAWRAAESKWPELFGAPEALARQELVVEQMRVVRPVIETGCVGCGIECLELLVLRNKQPAGLRLKCVMRMKYSNEDSRVRLCWPRTRGA